MILFCPWETDEYDYQKQKSLGLRGQNLENFQVEEWRLILLKIII